MWVEWHIQNGGTGNLERAEFCSWLAPRIVSTTRVLLVAVRVQVVHGLWLGGNEELRAETHRRGEGVRFGRDISDLLSRMSTSACNFYGKVAFQS